MATDETTLLFQSHKLTAALSAKEMLLAACRADPRVFNEYVLRDEETGGVIEQGPAHDEWQVTLCQESRAVIWSHVEAGKTNQISIGRALWELGTNPNLRIVILCKTELLAKKIVRAIAQYITRSPQLREVFPHLRPSTDQSAPWTQTQLTVERPNVGEKEPSVQAFGIGGALTGSRVDLAILDDLLDYKNTRTKATRDEVWNWVQATLFGRLTRAARVWAVGNAWHPDDAMHRLAALPRYKSYRFPVLNEKGESTWPKQWPLERIAASKDEMTPVEFARQLLCMARDDDEASFKAEWIEVCLERGRGYSLVPSLFDEDGTSLLPNGFAVFHGVDLASRKTESADFTSIFTIMLWPDGTRQPLNVLTKRLNGPEIIEAIDDVHQRYGGIFMVENVAAQQYILDFAKGLTRALIRPFTTGKNKVDPHFGVASLAAEMSGGRWLIPNGGKGKLATELEAWRQEMLFFNPKNHTGDRLMASWFAREGARQYEARKRARVGNVGVRIIGVDKPAPERAITT